MLIQSSLSSVEAGLCNEYNDGENFQCDGIPGGETWQVCLKCNKYSIDWSKKANPMEEDRRNADDPYNSNCVRSSGQPSTASIMTEKTAPNIVYRRKKLRKGSTAPLFKLGPTDVTIANIPSVISSSLHLSSGEDQTTDFVVRHQIELVKEPTLPSVLLAEAAKDITQKKLGIGSVNDSCSSSKSNMALVSGSLDTEMDNSGECSSSGVIGMDAASEDLTEKEFCVNILRSHGLLRGDTLRDNVVSVEDAVTIGNNYCSRSCKICGHLDSSVKMLLCDHCEDSYHPYCYNSRLKKIPIDEWFCHPCLNKRQKILKETIIKSPGINSEMRKCRTVSIKGEMNPILLMLRDTERYTSGVRVGKGFQAAVPDWSSPVKSDEDDFPEPLEINPSEFYRTQEEKMRNPIRVTIGNWLQCQEVIDKTSETICGKWRRAPLFEVQTNGWECFCAIHWDPYHADCSVPQVIRKQLVVMLVPNQI
ncbi:hypothetical protein KIW84_051587 [Lathyrus oleraceus]|uniref:Uncharacterized protein n=1 Tax=Pisum sativum TaxID=3888 RepID=A0A9D5AAV9_PEA|nr:hypothetical protein KIW84_051587 [Pisum sativum]